MMTLKLKKKRELDFWAGKLSGVQSGTGYVRDVIDILYTDKWLRDLIYQKRQVINE